MPVKFAPVSDVNGQARAPQARATGFAPVKTGLVKYLFWKWRKTLDSFGAQAGPAARPVALSPAWPWGRGKAHWPGCMAAEYGLSRLAACKIIFLAAFAASFAT